MDESITLDCEEGPMPRTSFLFRDWSVPRATEEANARHGKSWTLKLEPERVRLLDEQENLLLEVPRLQAEEVIRIPFRSWDPERIVNLGIADGQGDFYWFKPQRGKIKQIKRYVNLTIILEGPEAYARMRGEAWGAFIFGCIAFPASIALAAVLAWLIQTFTQTYFGTAVAVVGTGFLVIGATTFGYGIRSLLRFRELSRLRNEPLRKSI